MRKIEKWIDNSKSFMESIGLKKGYKLLDFGCGDGNYTIAAAKFLEGNGKVYSLDKDRDSLRKLRMRAEHRGLHNINIIETDGEYEIPADEKYFDFIFLYDIIHLFTNASNIYSELSRVLDENGVLSVYPTHHGSESLLEKVKGGSRDKNLNEILEEIENSGFSLEESMELELVHNKSILNDKIFNFGKK